MTNEEIFRMLLAQKLEQGEPEYMEMYVNQETNTIHVLVADDHMLMIWSPDTMFKYMSDVEINEFLTKKLKE
jgi:hypothetical protein